MMVLQGAQGAGVQKRNLTIAEIANSVICCWLMKENNLRNKHVPFRSCIICNSKSSKSDLLRIVRAESGSIVVDETGKLNGRGAYLCNEPVCWEKAATTDRLSKALRVSTNSGSTQKLLSSIQSSIWQKKELASKSARRS